jgi:hypothetical protein
MWTRRLRCPHCQGEFDYDFVPGGSVTAVRLGTSRYMRCPLCHRFGLFRLWPKTDASGEASAGTTRPSQGTGIGPTTGETTPRFTDRRPLARWGVLLMVPAMVLILSGVLLRLSTPSELVLAAVGVGLLCVGTALLLAFSLPDRLH